MATLNPKHAVYGLKGYLEVEGRRTPIVSATIEFCINQIPVANVIIPAGKEMVRDIVGPPAPLFSEEELTGKKRAKIIITGRGRPHPEGVDATPKGPLDATVIFDGYLMAKNIQFSTNGVSASVVLFHWLHDLDTSSFATGSFIKASPQDWFNVEPSTEVTEQWGSLYRTPDNGKIEPIDIKTKDWWSEILKPGMEYKANQKFVLFVDPPEPNTDILKALPNIDGNLKLLDGANTDDVIASGIHNKFSRIMMYSEGGSSAFEKLVSLGREFKFMLVPAVDKSLVAPYNPLAPTTVTLTESEFDFGFAAPNPVVIPRGAILYGSPINLTVVATDGANANSAAGANNSINSFFRGYYIAPLAAKLASGPFFTLLTPEWMQTSNTIKTDPLKKIKMLSDGDSSKGSAPNQAEPIEHDQKLPNNYAKAMYFDALFATRIQEVICGFRLDIAPGNCILLKGGSSGQNIPGLASNWEKRGFVESVTYILSGTEPARINTVYRLRHVFDKSDIQLFEIGNGLPHPFLSSDSLNEKYPIKKL